MLQSEHWGWPQAAASFAQAAMRQVEVVYAQANAPQSDQDRVDWTRQRHSRESMLCTNLFVYALEAGQYEVRLLGSLAWRHPSCGMQVCCCGMLYRKLLHNSCNISLCFCEVVGIKQCSASRVLACTDVLGAEQPTFPALCVPCLESKVLPWSR